MHVAAQAYANEILMRLDRSLDKNLSLIIFRKTTQPFLMCFKEIIFRLKV